MNPDEITFHVEADGHRRVEPTTDFDYSQVDAALGWEERGNPLLGLTEDVTAQSDRIAAIFAWISDAQTIEAVGVRAIAVGWATNPEYFGGDSLPKVAARYGAPKQRIHNVIRRLRQLFPHLGNRASWSEEQRASLRKARMKKAAAAKATTATPNPINAPEVNETEGA
jgi:hypothetical protein